MARRWLKEFPSLTEGGFGRPLRETFEGEDEAGGGAVLLRDFYESPLCKRISARFLARRDELRR